MPEFGDQVPGLKAKFDEMNASLALKGSGDMAKAVYDPTNINGSAFARANHTGVQAQSTVTNLTSDLAGKQPLDADLTALAGLAGVEGDIIFRDATQWQRLPKGTANQRLSMNAGATVPEWQTVASGAGTPWAEVEVDFGVDLYQKAKSFVITNAAITTAHKIAVVQSFAAPTGKAQDDCEMDAFIVRAVSGTGEFTMFVESLTGSVHGRFKFNYVYS